MLLDRGRVLFLAQVSRDYPFHQLRLASVSAGSMAELVGIYLAALGILFPQR
ncbi:hypothetical protein [Pontibacter pamirensis]|uniref:hypothetical protein n=1 Tax=Pontibacter pamirensis TaxID=2562824 RepID=UPI00138978A9|nr:hypothetical protein [Pontibacter pamirensis]